jgi:two-component system LytT family response regulator
MNSQVLVINYRNEDRITIFNFLDKEYEKSISFEFCDNYNESEVILSELEYEFIILYLTKESLQESLLFLENIQHSKTPILIISNSKDFAYNFFKYNVVDYLITPTKSSEINTIIKHHINLEKRRKTNFVFNTSVRNKFQNFITINSTKKIELIKLEDIVCLEADGRYTIVHLENNTKRIASKNIGEFQVILNPDFFCRIHHKYILNLKKLININKVDGLFCEMENGKIIPVSKRKFENLNSILNLGKISIA